MSERKHPVQRLVRRSDEQCRKLRGLLGDVRDRGGVGRSGHGRAGDVFERSMHL
jgi:hypothetical protein